MSQTSPRIAILGAGPVGLEAAILAARLEIPFSIYEAGRVGEHLRQWGHVRMFSPFGMNTTPLGLELIRREKPHDELPSPGTCISGREHVAAYLEPIAASRLVREHLLTETRVLGLGRRGLMKEELAGDPGRAQHPFQLLVRGPRGERVEEATVVLDCTGTYGRHRYLGEGGLPALGELEAGSRIAYGVEDVLGERAAHYADRTVLVAGSGYSAATAVCGLARLAEKHGGTWVIWVTRAGRSQPVQRMVNDPLRERDQLAVRANQLATRGEGNVEYHPQTVITQILSQGADQGFMVQARSGGREMVWEVDRIVGNVGYAPDTGIFRELQVSPSTTLEAVGTSFTPSPPGGEPAAGDLGTVRTTEPGFFVLGAKSMGRSSSFLLQTGLEQVRQVFRAVGGKG